MKKIILSVVMSCVVNASWACTDIKVSASDGTVMIARSMEFALALNSNLITSPRGREIISTPNNKPGLRWRAKYGYVFLDAENTGVAVEGMNEHGLSFEALYLPGETQYQDVPLGKEKQAMGYLNFGDWVLGNFKNIAELKSALPKIFIASQTVAAIPNMVFPLHFSIYENTGKGIVIELTKGQVHVYDNQLGVMTNSPTYDWQITNLRNYINLSPTTPSPLIDNNITFVATGQGSGMHGLPGDVSPPSRFVKMALMLKSIFQPTNADEALNMAQHIINTVDIPLGFVRESQDVNRATTELTQWVVFKDLTHKIFYYRTYTDLNLHKVDLTQLDFSEKSASHKIPIQSKQSIIDMTADLNAH